MNYSDFLKQKMIADSPCGIRKEYKLNPAVKDFQAACIQWALRRGRALLGEDCGLGKTLQELEWARIVHQHTGGNVLILTPLTVAQQTISEGEKFGIQTNLCRSQSDVKPGINVTNYEMLHHFEPSKFIGVVLDEASIIKNYSGKTRNQIIEAFKDTPYRLEASATPAPNDYMELGNHAEFLGVMTRPEMLATFFVHDGGDTSKWRLKGHAHEPFWRWMASWAICIKQPSDIGFSNDGYTLQPLKVFRHVIPSTSPSPGYLFAIPGQTLQEQRAIKRDSINERVGNCAFIVNHSSERWVIWGELNKECDLLEKSCQDSIQISGRDSIEEKERKITAFVSGRHKVLVSKVSICGYGLNLQSIANTAFVNISHSFEDQYQAIRRFWRFGQRRTVRVHTILMDVESNILANVERKTLESENMSKAMIQHMSVLMQDQLGATKRQSEPYTPNAAMELPSWIRSE